MEIDANREKVDYVENKVCDFMSAHNKLVDTHFELEVVNQTIQNKSRGPRRPGQM